MNKHGSLRMQHYVATPANMMNGAVTFCGSYYVNGKSLLPSDPEERCKFPAMHPILPPRLQNEPSQPCSMGLLPKLGHLHRSWGALGTVINRKGCGVERMLGLIFFIAVLLIPLFAMPADHSPRRVMDGVQGYELK